MLLILYDAFLKQVKNGLKESHGKGFLDLPCSHYKLHQAGSFTTAYI